MIFGPTPLSAAEGAVLAHSVPLPKGRLRKGRVLDADDIQALADAGLTEVTVARLEPGDVAEDAAAARLAGAVLTPAALAAGRISATRAHTGRVNLIAEGPGVAKLDVAALEAVNAVHPMITIATVPPWQQMARGGLLATIKIISYAVPEEALRAAETAAGRAAIDLAAPMLKSAQLLITEIPGGVGDKGKLAIAARLEALTVDLKQTVMLPHRVADLAAALRTAGQDQSCDLLLILTGSATSDCADVAPAALRAAGGRVARFGMPVDPGNLLFIGDLAGKAVIGLPGCARAPALNGADWVLSRVICGLPVGAAEIAAMGVGGLLKEIPSRPHPRRSS